MLFENKEKKILFVLSTIFFIIFLLFLYLFLVNKDKHKNTEKKPSSYIKDISFEDQSLKTNFDFSKSITTDSQTIPDDKIILEVGDEKIFYLDFLGEIEAMYLTKDNVTNEIKSNVLNKLILDSIYLQYGFRNGIIDKNNAPYFNNINKKYSERINKVKLVEENIKNTQLKKISGKVFTVFFYNIELGDLSYEESKKIAFSKIDFVYQKLKNSEIDIYRAIEILKNDVDLKKIDKARETNIYFDFDSFGDQRISSYKDFDAIIRSTQKNQLTSIYTGKDYLKNENDINVKNKLVDSIYMFAFISDKSDQGFNSLQDWYEKNILNYEVKIN